MEIAAGEFKAKCLKLMCDIHEYHEEVIITKFGKPVAKLVPVKDKKAKSLFGVLKDSLFITGNIVKPTGEKWSSDD